MSINYLLITKGTREAFVDDEIGELETAGLLKPGIESYLAQFWPRKESLFFGRFDIQRAREEFEFLTNLIKSQGVEVFDIRNAYASTLSEPDLSITTERLIKKLIEKVPPQNQERVDETTLERLLHEEALAYGESRSAALTIALSHAPKIPLGNLYFARDPANVLSDTIFLGNMAYEIRKPEVNIMHKALEKLGYGNFFQVKSGAFEGGDAMMIQGKAYIGVGTRTTPEAAREIATYLKYFKRIRSYMVKIPSNGTWDDNMRIMHLDTFFMSLKKDTVIGCKNLLGQCTIYDIETGTSANFLEYLQDNFTVLDTPPEEQMKYAANMLVIKPGLVITPSDYNIGTNAVLEANGITTINANLRQLTEGYGATHCTGLSVKRGLLRRMA